MDENLELRLIAEREEEKSDLKRRVWVETKKIWRIAFPTMLTRVTSYGMIIVTQSFLGHIGEVQLATFALIQSIFVRFINGILIGMSSATETLCGQAFGARQYHMMGIYLQRSWIVDCLMGTVSVPLLVFASPIFKLLRQEEEIAEAAGNISLWFIPMLYQMVFQLTMQMFLQDQLKNFIVGRLSAFAFALHLLLSWILVYKLNWGVAGAMGSLNICCWIMVVGEFAALYDLWPTIKLSMASGLMICLELWYYAILVLLAGYMKNATIAIDAFSICLNVNACEFMICLGLTGAAIVRVANELGRGNTKALKFAIKTIMSESICIGMLFFVLCLGCWRQISYLFTSDEQVAQVISSLSDLLAISVLFNSVAIGTGFQSTVAIVNLGCFYIVGVPVGVMLGSAMNIQVTGLWIGLLSGVALQIIILVFIVWRIDWDEQVENTSQRLNHWLIEEEEEKEEEEEEEE
ncbi:hypothetical protein ES319_A11G243300v1 [Gossypium barbadense]|uniref:Protein DETOXIFICATION n=1 Tax=Gossypium barbadense TaxID=3634 RepID=A0A5J5TSG3_GOSBA|nr:hypothetical protein ES319_A11G243300v1 [Gossypium barbadense]